MAEEISAKIVLEGEKEFRQALSQINAGLKVQQASLKSVTAEYGKNNQSIEALQSTSKALMNVLTSQKEKLALLGQGLAEATEKYGSGSVRVEKLRLDFINTEAAIHGLNRSIEENQQAVKDQLTSTDSITAALEIANQQVQQYRDALQGATEKYGDLHPKTKQYQQAVEDVERDIGSLNETLRENEKQAEKTGDSTNTAGKEMQNLGEKAEGSQRGISVMTVALGDLVSKGLQKVVSAMKDAIQEGLGYHASLESTNAVLEQIFGPRGQAMVDEWAATSMEALGLAEGTAKEYAKELGLIFSETKKTSAQTAEMSIAVIEAARDWASFTNNSPTDVLNAIESALTGNLKGLSKYGIVLSDTEVANTRYVKSLGKSWSELSDGEKILARQIAILEKLADAEGHFAENQDSYSNGMNTWKEALKKLTGEISKEIAPALTDFFRETTGYLQENEQALTTIGAVIATVIGIVNDFLKLLSKLPSEVWLTIGAFVVAIKTFSTVEKGISAVSGVLEIFTFSIDKTVIKILAIVAALAVLLYLIVAIRDGSDEAAKSLERAGNAAGNFANQNTNAASPRMAGASYSVALPEMEEPPLALPLFALPAAAVPQIEEYGNPLESIGKTVNAVINAGQRRPALAGGAGTVPATEPTNYTYIDSRRFNIGRVNQIDDVVNAYNLSRIHRRAGGGE